MEPKISIIIPVYKTAERLLRVCIESALAQTLPDFELILVDDGSPDRCGAICDEYAADARVRVIHKENAGVSVARNVGLEAAKGAYICFVDADDYMEPAMLAVLYDAIRAQDAQMVICDIIYDYEDHTEVWRNQAPALADGPETERLALLDLAAFSVWGRLIRRDAIGELRYLPELFQGQDVEYITRVTLPMTRVCFCAEPLYHYRQNAQSVMHRPFELKMLRLYDAQKRIAETVLAARPDFAVPVAQFRIRYLGYTLGQFGTHPCKSAEARRRIRECAREVRDTCLPVLTQPDLKTRKVIFCIRMAAVSPMLFWYTFYLNKQLRHRDRRPQQ